ncbi:MAG: polyprenyl synthetase family protein [Yersiniaceae bacterium]|uniref:Geranylgeranyl pyrophosphate synthase n=1 Tax=Chimaeribacter coloradensis TaxID=2060068 RepID=A0A2N5EB75_9GAMM|nr:polyprenyl synthetase family protein [Chimaeribacter coloradensis]MDU6410253.1 polyprenyl synthetase family protein [Yersiniaceae bacterium]PLR39355.1 geranylgeranyl pyrophosphate synthase [Chimaeribacter coloradensis]
MTAYADKPLSLDSELPALIAALETRLDQLLPESSERDRVNVAMREGTLAPGKRIRPLLLMLAAQDLGCDTAQAGLLDLACAVEMIHAASLMLDDIPCMDNALLRRGRPTIHRQFGENVAILAAVALLSKAFGVVAAAQDLPSHARTQAVAELSSAVGLQGLVQGQYQDLTEGNDARSADAIFTTNELKTSMLFGATLQMAAIAAGAPADVRQKLRCFALDLGQAFQLLDDLVDGLAGTGKDRHKDEGKSTLVAMLGSEAVHQRLHHHLRRADEHLACACDQGMATRRFMHAWFGQKLALIS